MFLFPCFKTLITWWKLLMELSAQHLKSTMLQLQNLLSSRTMLLTLMRLGLMQMNQSVSAIQHHSEHQQNENVHDTTFHDQLVFSRDVLHTSANAPLDPKHAAWHAQHEATLAFFVQLVPVQRCTHSVPAFVSRYRTSTQQKHNNTLDKRIQRDICGEEDGSKSALLLPHLLTKERKGEETRIADAEQLSAGNGSKYINVIGRKKSRLSARIWGIVVIIIRGWFCGRTHPLLGCVRSRRNKCRWFHEISKHCGILYNNPTIITAQFSSLQFTSCWNTRFAHHRGQRRRSGYGKRSWRWRRPRRT